VKVTTTGLEVVRVQIYEFIEVFDGTLVLGEPTITITPVAVEHGVVRPQLDGLV